MDTGVISRVSLGCVTPPGRRRGKDFHYEVQPNGCHHCISHKPHADGYTSVNTRAGYRLLHRLVYQLRHGDLSSGMVVRHTCDNSRCINPDHLVRGTQLENMQDKVARGRAGTWTKQPAPDADIRAGDHVVLGGVALRVYTLRPAEAL